MKNIYFNVLVSERLVILIYSDLFCSILLTQRFQFHGRVIQVLNVSK